MNNRKRKRSTYARAKAFHAARHWMTDEEYTWEYMAPIGREFGSPDFDRLFEIEMLANRAIIEPCTETGWLVGHVPGIAGAHTQGETRVEVISNLQEVLEMMSSHYQGRSVRKDPRKKIPENEQWLYEKVEFDDH